MIVFRGRTSDEWLDRWALYVTDKKRRGIKHTFSTDHIFWLSLQLAGVVFIGLYIVIPMYLMMFANYFWCHMRVGSRSLDAKSLTCASDIPLTKNQIHQLDKMAAPSPSLWVHHHEERFSGREYTSQELSKIQLYRKRLRIIRKMHPVLVDWADKALVEAVNVYERYAAYRKFHLVDFDETFIRYLKLCQLAGSPIKQFLDTNQLDDLINGTDQANLA